MSPTFFEFPGKLRNKKKLINEYQYLINIEFLKSFLLVLSLSLSLSSVICFHRSLFTLSPDQKVELDLGVIASSLRPAQFSIIKVCSFFSILRSFQYYWKWVVIIRFRSFLISILWSNFADFCIDSLCFLSAIEMKFHLLCVSYLNWALSVSLL